MFVQSLSRNLLPLSSNRNQEAECQPSFVTLLTWASDCPHHHRHHQSPVLNSSVLKAKICRLRALPSLTSQCPAVARWAVAPAFPLWGELLGGQARPVGSHSCLWSCRPSSWARELLQQSAVRLHKRLYAPGSFGIGWVPSGNEGKAPSELDKSCSGAGSNRHLTSLNFQCSSFQRHTLCLNLL